MKSLRNNSVFLSLMLAVWLAVPAVFGQTVPSPEEFLGYKVGAEKKLVRWDKIVEYMRLAAQDSDRVAFEELGRSTNGNPLIMMVVSSPDNLRNLSRYREINRRLFDPRTIASDEEAKGLIQQGRLFVLVTCNIHSTEIGASQMSLELVHQLATDDSPRTRKILDNVVFLLAPSLNPDGQIMVTDWYNKNLGTPYENAPLPWLYHPYVGHDNNRDAYMFTQKESRLLGKVVFQDWLPEVWLDEHQMGSSGPRIFVMPAADPINPNVDPIIYRYTGLLGFSQGAALEKAGKEGIIYGQNYTYWWEGAMAWAGWWHNMYGLLTEVASTRLGTSIEQQKADPNRPPRPQPRGERSRGDRDPGRPLPPPTDIQFRSQYPRPWLGGRWTLRDIVDYELIATDGLLETGADMRTQLLEGLYAAGRHQIEKGKKGDPFAIVIPRDQHDFPTAVKMLQTLALGGVEVERARQAFSAGGKEYPAGSYVIEMAQPFRAYAKDMLEPQVYPKISPAPGIAPDPPYDAAGWSLGLQMGVETDFVKEPFEADLEKLDTVKLPEGKIAGAGRDYILSHAANNSLVACNRLLKEGYQVLWLTEPATVGGKSYPEGTIVARGGEGLAQAMADITKSLGIDAAAADLPDDVSSIRIQAPRTALYQPWGGNADEGWTRWLLEQNEFPYTTIHPEDLRSGNPSEKFDLIIFPDMRTDQILNGWSGRSVPEKYQGGIAESGVEALRSFMQSGGSVITLGRSTGLMLDKLAAPYRDALRGVRRTDFLCPGSILRVLIDNTHPIGYGMGKEASAYFSNSMALEPAASFSNMHASIIIRYPNGDLLESGWLHGDSYLYDKVGAAEVKFGNGRMVLIPTKVQQRAQPYGTFKILFNAILTSRAEASEPE